MPRRPSILPRVARVALLAGLASAATGARPATGPSADAEAQRAHAQGTCGQLGPGTGLSGDKGWVVSMIPGRHEFRMRGGGAAYVTVARLAAVDVDAGRPYYIVIEGARPGAVLEWKTPASDWAPVSRFFLYPVQR